MTKVQKEKKKMGFGKLLLIGGFLFIGNYVFNDKDEREDVKPLAEEVVEIDRTALNEENIETIINDVMEKETNHSKDKQLKRVESITINEKYVIIQINADRITTYDYMMYKFNEINEEMKEIETDKEIIYDVKQQLVDDKGHPVNSTILSFSLTQDVLQSINFENFNIEGYKVYSTNLFVHPIINSH